MYKAVIFDLDGTIADSLEGIMLSAAYGLKAIGIEEEDPEKLKTFAGPPLKQHYMEFAGVGPDEAQIAFDAFREMFGREGMYKNALFPNIKEILEGLKKRGVKVALATTKGLEDANRVLDLFDIGKYFDALVTADMFENIRTKAEMIDKSLEMLEIRKEPGAAVMVGDRFYDVKGGNEAGVDTIGVLYGFGSRQEIEDCHPTYVAENTVELAAILFSEAGDGNEFYRSYEIFHKKEEAYGSRYKASTGRRVWDVIYPVLIYEGVDLAIEVIILIAASLFSVFSFFTGKGMSGIPDSWLIAGTIANYVICSFIFIFLLIRDKKEYGIIGGNRAFSLSGKLDIPIAVITGAGLSMAINMFIVLTGLSSIIESSESRTVLFSQGIIVELILLCVLTPFAEEVLFRGVVFGRLRRSVSFWPAALISAAIFGALHFELVTSVSAFVVGILFAYVYEKTGSILVGMIIHFAYNLFPTIINALMTEISVLGALITMIVGIIAAASGIFVFVKRKKC